MWAGRMTAWIIEELSQSFKNDLWPHKASETGLLGGILGDGNLNGPEKLI